MFGFGFSIEPIVVSFVVFVGLFQVNGRRYLNKKRIFYDSKRCFERRAGPRATRSTRISLLHFSRCLMLFDDRNGLLFFGLQISDQIS